MGEPTPRFEDDPLTRAEYITAMVRFYRAEVARSLAWRQRLDATTNRAVLTAVGPLSPTIVMSAGLVFRGLLLGAILLGRKLGGGEPEDELAGLEANLAEWKL